MRGSHPKPIDTLEDFEKARSEGGPGVVIPITNRLSNELQAEKYEALEFKEQKPKREKFNMAKRSGFKHYGKEKHR